ncbi:MAG TPA: DNA mismatch repair protein MutS, partial [Lachnospiraceae bacterium]|nr:DNA mismatch repair protein MutS [Lachnospiraceae bacterium]
DVDALIGVMGYVETAIAVGAFRKSLEMRETGWCAPEFIDREQIEIVEGYHPLLECPVKNGITAARGVLLTGSNASGKSTFLKT